MSLQLTLQVKTPSSLTLPLPLEGEGWMGVKRLPFATGYSLFPEPVVPAM